jgi:hypothetical protein
MVAQRSRDRVHLAWKQKLLDNEKREKERLESERLAREAKLTNLGLTMPTAAPTPTKTTAASSVVTSNTSSNGTAKAATVTSPSTARKDPPVETRTHIFCTQCGNKEKITASFCTSCGVPMVMPPVLTADPSGGVESRAAAAVTAKAAPSTTAARSKPEPARTPVEPDQPKPTAPEPSLARSAAATEPARTAHEPAKPSRIMPPSGATRSTGATRAGTAAALPRAPAASSAPAHADRKTCETCGKVGGAGAMATLKGGERQWHCQSCVSKYEVPSTTSTTTTTTTTAASSVDAATLRTRQEVLAPNYLCDVHSMTICRCADEQENRAAEAHRRREDDDQKDVSARQHRSRGDRTSRVRVIVGGCCAVDGRARSDLTAGDVVNVAVLVGNSSGKQLTRVKVTLVQQTSEAGAAGGADRVRESITWRAYRHEVLVVT